MLQLCRYQLTAKGAEPLTAAMRQQAVRANDALACRGFRVIGVALRSGGDDLQTLAPEALESKLTLIGLIVKLIGDLTYVWVDPRIDFATRDVG